MDTLNIILLVIFTIAFGAFSGCAIKSAITNKIGWTFGALGSIVVVFVSLIIIMARDKKTQELRPKEFPATEYTFQYKVVEMGEQRDTIYVITKKQ